MKLGFVTYNIAKDWDVPAIIKMGEATGFEAVELRTTHAHGVEPSLSKEQREEVKKRFADAKVRLLSLGSACDYHSPDQAQVRKNIEDTKAFVLLAKDVGAVGVKVRPNGLPEGVTREKTIEQIGKALWECGVFAEGHGIGIWLEVHGKQTSDPRVIHAIMKVANHPSVGICWNSNTSDVIDGAVKENFELLRPWLRNAHITELWNPGYPYRELFRLMADSKYEGCTLAEIPESAEPERLMRYYRALWLCLQRK